MKSSASIKMCDHRNSVKSNGYIVCSDCGLVIDDYIYANTNFIVGSTSNIYTKNGYRQYTNFMDFTTLGYNSTLNTSFSMKDHRNAYLTSKSKETFKRLKRVGKYGIDSYNIHIVTLKSYMDMVNKKLGLSELIKKNAIYFFLKILRENKKVRNRVVLAITCVYQAVRTTSDINKVTIIDIIKEYRLHGSRVNSRLIIECSLEYEKYFPKKTVRKPLHYIPIYLNILLNNKRVVDYIYSKGCHWNKDKINAEIQSTCIEFLNKIPKAVWGGSRPTNIACISIYSAGILLANRHDFRKPFTVEMLAKHIETVHQYSIRQTYNERIKPFFIKDNLKYVNNIKS